MADRLQRILIWLLILAVGVFLLERLFVLLALFATPLLLFGLAWLIALVLQPMVNWMTQLTLPVPFISKRVRGSAAISPTWRLPRGIAVLLVYLALIAVVVILVISLVPVIGSQLVGIETTLPDAVTTEFSTWMTGIESELVRLGFRGDLNQIVPLDTLTQQATNVGTTLIQQSLTILSSIAALLFNLVIVLILSFYMTLDGTRLALRVMEMLPRSWHADTRRFFRIVNQTFGGFLRAQLVQAFLYGVATAVLMATLQLNYIALSSVLAALLVLIPLIGGLFAIVPPLLIALIERPDQTVIALIGLIVIQQVMFNIIMPRLMGRIVGLHPLLVFAAILVGAALAGGWGILFGIPIAGVVASVLHFLYLRATAEQDVAIGETPP